MGVFLIGWGENEKEERDDIYWGYGASYYGVS